MQTKISDESEISDESKISRAVVHRLLEWYWEKEDWSGFIEVCHQLEAPPTSLSTRITYDIDTEARFLLGVANRKYATQLGESGYGEWASEQAQNQLFMARELGYLEQLVTQSKPEGSTGTNAQNV